MTENQYSKLHEACDKVLLSDLHPTRIAIPWLHVLNEHPANLAKYLDISDGNPKVNYSLKSLFTQFLGIWRSIWLKKSNLSKQQVPDVLFISHLLNEGQIGASEDFYFGNLPEILHSKGFKSSVVLINHTENNLSDISRRWASHLSPRIILSKSLSVRKEFALRKKLKQESTFLIKSAENLEDKFLKDIYGFASEEALSVSAISTMRIYMQILEMCEIFKPKAIVVTYEGHAWERLAFQAARISRTDVKCIGYNHTILFPRQHAALRPLNSEYDADIILTAGDITQKHFQRRLPNAAVHSMGIHRRFSSITLDLVSDRPHNCLVIPDGIVSEIVFMFDFAITAALSNSDINYIFRLHPIISKDRLLVDYPRFAELPNNVEFSNRSISDDFNLCRWVLYRGSNASIYAVISGLRPFYIKKDGELPIDCLYEVNSWKKVISDTDDFIIQMQMDLQEIPDTLSFEAKNTIDYCNSFFKPLNDSLLQELLNNN